MWALLQTDRDAVDAWEAETDQAAKTADYNALSSNAQQLALRIQRGQTNYAKYIPIARRTSYYLTDPSVQQCGQVQTPLTAVYPPNYQWVLTADRAVRRGFLWERVREWTGFAVVDTQIINNA